EVEAALALNDDYRLAIDLKALILADQGGVAQARDFLIETDRRRGENGPGHTHEGLFGAYLRGVLALLTGHPEEVVAHFSDWRDLAQGFGRAELLLAAAEDLTAAPESCRKRLESLAHEWSAEPVYAWLLACHHLAYRRYRDLTALLARWPGSRGDEDWRPLYLEGHLAVCQGRTPALPDEAPPPLTVADVLPAVGPDAWLFLAARVAFLRGDDALCLKRCAELVRGGPRTERLARLELAAAAGDESGDTGALAWAANPLPDSCLPGRVQQQRRLGSAEADGLLENQIRLHPEDPAVCWLAPSFWLVPIRGWLA
ncbi:hypothetical protein DRQ50_04310, partial [bacterium]